jgi:hypothetical protein
MLGVAAALYDVFKPAGAAAEQPTHDAHFAPLHELEHELSVCNVFAFVGLDGETAVVAALGDEVGGGGFDFKLIAGVGERGVV